MAKGPDAFRTISEAADELNVPQHVLRFWETKFSFIRPMKRAGGRRFYRPQDIAVLKGVRRLLHDDGYTIKGVQRLFREQGVRRLIGAGEGEAPPPPEGDLTELLNTDLDEEGRERLSDALQDLEAAKQRLDRLLGR
ncbi:MerR family transcriptional regulator [Phenylobacterium deserti]|uniref:MerR family transcriptional regulator n=1 Tax=Phenylobacterium deserti TaxID=1914756 RepID=A0A328AF56_9CAUL|nr:MerR family transcriptional regulator [Phenylobacterium deserti]RAK52034.1 MerR family transcriptional regulator [Phenylobacterium deserti]